MALINCYECGKQISDSAQACPNCGAPVKKQEKKKFCKYCGTSIKSEASFCPACGKPQSSNNAQQTQVPVQPAGPQVNYRPQQFAAMNPQPYFMPCAHHVNNPAVAACGSCGKSICNECADKSEYRMDNIPLCRDCNLQVMQKQISESESTRTWAWVKLIFLLICIGFAWMVYSSSTNNDQIIAAWIIAGFGGLPSAMRMAFHRSEPDKALMDLHTRVDPGNGCMQEIIWFIVALLLSFAFAPIMAVVFVFKNLSLIISNSNFLKDERVRYANLVQELQGE